jgi:MoaA/NifB/PqqE/SkfB family radical SAM enzyme
MTENTYRKVVARAVEYGRVESFALCGLGEPLLHPKVVDFVRIASEAGLRPSVVTNGSLLTEHMSRSLVEAGLRNVNLSIGGHTKETYEAVHRGLRFDDVRRNALAFLRVAQGRAVLNLQISPTQDTLREAPQMAAFWRAEGARFCFIFPFSSSRGGSLSGAVADAGAQVGLPEGCISIEELFRPTRRDARIMRGRTPFVCYAKDRVTFVSWEGRYHLCCNDYEKHHALGDVFTASVDEAYARKAGASRATNLLCARCNFAHTDLAPQDLAFYWGMVCYLGRSAVLRMNARLWPEGTGFPPSRTGKAQKERATAGSSRPRL